MVWILSLLFGADSGSCINPWGACKPAEARIGDNG